MVKIPRLPISWPSGGDQHIVDELGHTARSVLTSGMDAAIASKRHNRLTLSVAGHEQRVETVEHRTQFTVPWKVMYSPMLSSSVGAQAQLVVLGQVVLGAEHIQVEVHEALVAQHFARIESGRSGP